MKFPWHKYKETSLDRRNTLQVFIVNVCNRVCDGCFARHVMDSSQPFISLEEYETCVQTFLRKGGKQINLLGGEPLLHPELRQILDVNRREGIKTTVYTNGDLLGQYTPDDFKRVKVRVSIYSEKGVKGAVYIPKTDIPFEANFMVSAGTTVEEMLKCAQISEEHGCKTFFIFSMRELDNPRKEFFEDTPLTGSVLQYKMLVHQFLGAYDGPMDIHVSKRGVFESTTTLPDTRCRFANYFIGGRIIQCPYSVVNCDYQDDYEFGTRPCQHNSTCLMSKVVYRSVR